MGPRLRRTAGSVGSAVIPASEALEVGSEGESSCGLVRPTIVLAPKHFLVSSPRFQVQRLCQPQTRKGGLMKDA